VAEVGDSIRLEITTGAGQPVNISFDESALAVLRMKYTSPYSEVLNVENERHDSAEPPSKFSRLDNGEISDDLQPPEDQPNPESAAQHVAAEDDSIPEDMFAPWDDLDEI
jgi:hypothetical protein